MTKNNETTANTTITAESLVADAAKDNLVTPTVPAQSVNDKDAKISVDVFNEDETAEDTDAQSTAPKFRAVVAGEDGEPHHFDSVAGLLKHITIRAFKNRKVQVATGAVVTAGVTIFAVTRKKAAELIELSDEDETVDETTEDFTDLDGV
jgi:hypothetical protein